MRLILFLFILYLLYRILRHLPNLIRFALKLREEKSTRQPRQEAHDMVSCSTCGTYVAASQALSQSGKYYCGEKCRDHRIPKVRTPLD